MIVGPHASTPAYNLLPRRASASAAQILAGTAGQVRREEVKLQQVSIRLPLVTQRSAQGELYARQRGGGHCTNEIRLRSAHAWHASAAASCGEPLSHARGLPSRHPRHVNPARLPLSLVTYPRSSYWGPDLRAKSRRREKNCVPEQEAAQCAMTSSRASCSSSPADAQLGPKWTRGQANLLRYYGFKKGGFITVQMWRGRGRGFSLEKWNAGRRRKS